MPAPEDEVEVIEEVVVEGKSPNWGCLLIAFSPMAICGLALLGSVLFCGNTFSGIGSSFANILNGIAGIFNFTLFPSETTVTSTPAVVKSIKPLGQLVTVNAQFAIANIEVSTRYGVANVCYIGALHVAQGNVEAGIDLIGFNEEDVTFDAQNDQYTIRIPKPNLTGCYLDPIATSAYHNWGATVACPANWDEMRRIASYEAINKFRDSAIEGGLLDRAQEQADLVISNFVSSLTGKAVKIEFVEPEGVNYPASCMPTPPDPWIYNEDEKRWERD